MEFLRSFLRLHFAGKPVVASWIVGCFLRLLVGDNGKCARVPKTVPSPIGQNEWAMGRNYNNVLVTCVNLQLKTPSTVTLSSLETCWLGEKERPFISLRLQLIESYRTNCDFLCDALYLKDKLIKWRCYVCCFTPTWRRSSVVRFVILNTILLVDLLVNSPVMLCFSKLLPTSNVFIGCRFWDWTCLIPPDAVV